MFTSADRIRSPPSPPATTTSAVTTGSSAATADPNASSSTSNAVTIPITSLVVESTLDSWRPSEPPSATAMSASSAGAAASRTSCASVRSTVTPSSTGMASRTAVPSGLGAHCRGTVPIPGTAEIASAVSWSAARPAGVPTGPVTIMSAFFGSDCPAPESAEFAAALSLPGTSTSSGVSSPASRAPASSRTAASTHSTTTRPRCRAHHLARAANTEHTPFRRARVRQPNVARRCAGQPVEQRVPLRVNATGWTSGPW